MKTCHFPIQLNQGLGGSREIILLPHVLQLLCRLQRHRGAQIAEFTFEAVGRAHHPLGVGVNHRLSKSRQELWRFLQKDLAKFLQEFFISAQVLQGFSLAPQRWSAQNSGCGGEDAKRFFNRVKT